MGIKTEFVIGGIKEGAHNGVTTCGGHLIEVGAEKKRVWDAETTMFDLEMREWANIWVVGGVCKKSLN